jgi:hypothetical protein
MKIKLIMDEARARSLMKTYEIIARIGEGQFKDMLKLIKPDLSWDEVDQKRI